MITVAPAAPASAAPQPTSTGSAQGRRGVHPSRVDLGLLPCLWACARARRVAGVLRLVGCLHSRVPLADQWFTVHVDVHVDEEKEEIENFKKYVEVWKKFAEIDENINLLLLDELLILSKYDFKEPNDISYPPFKYPRVNFLVFDDLVGDPHAF